jgi:TonB family protein
MLGQIDVSYEGTLSQWQAALHRRSLLPAALSQVTLDKSPSWTLQTGRFTSSVPAEVLPLTDKSPMTLIMGYTREGIRAAWGVQGVWWNLDSRRDAAVGIWRRVRPPTTAKIELRNGFDSIRMRRAPFDGSLMRESAETYTATKIIDVPGKAPGTVASDLEYGLTLRLQGMSSLTETAAALKRIADSTHLTEKSLGADMPAPARELTAIDQAFATLERQMMSKAEEVNAQTGKDVRGRTFSDDLQGLLKQMKADSAAMRVSGDQTEADELFVKQNQRLSFLQSYWSMAPQLRRNRDMWFDFLRKNHLPLQTRHTAAVVDAEESLFGALAKPPGTDWLQQANQLKDAYIKERSDLVKSLKPDPSHNSPLADRHTPCPPSTPGTSGATFPKFLRSARQLPDMYPVESRRLGEEGTVIVTVRVSETGCVVAKAIAGSSGSGLLDDAVLEWLESVEFLPAEAAGHAVASTARLPVMFKLREN